MLVVFNKNIFFIGISLGAPNTSLRLCNRLGASGPWSPHRPRASSPAREQPSEPQQGWGRVPKPCCPPRALSHLVEVTNQPQQRGLCLCLQLIRVLLWGNTGLVRGVPTVSQSHWNPSAPCHTPLTVIQGTYWCGGSSASVIWALWCIRATPVSPCTQAVMRPLSTSGA